MSRSWEEIDTALVVLEKATAALQAPDALINGSGRAYSPGDIAWVLTSAAFVFLMIPGVGYFYSGVSGKKNAISMILLSLICTAIASMQWFIWGFSLAFSKTSTNSVIGDLSNAFLMNVWDDPSAPSGRIPNIVFCIYQNMFAAITPVITIGSATDRGRILPIFVYVFVWNTIVYCPMVYWTWNPNGWMNKLGSLDYAGATPIHIASGAAAMAYALVLGKRRVQETNPSSIAHVVLGSSFLWFGWFGFNSGSELSSNARSGMAFVAANVSASSAGCVWNLIEYVRYRKISAIGFCTGSIVGLVSVTGASGFVHPWAAAVIGAIGAVLSNMAIKFKEDLAWDDACDVFAVHTVGGFAGNILTGIFASRSAAGLDGSAIAGGWVDGNWIQVAYQLAVAVTGFAYAFLGTYAILWVMDRIPGLHLRATEEEERLGMDAVFFGEDYQQTVDGSRKFVAEDAALKAENGAKQPEDRASKEQTNGEQKTQPAKAKSVSIRAPSKLH